MLGKYIDREESATCIIRGILNIATLCIKVLVEC